MSHRGLAGALNGAGLAELAVSLGKTDSGSSLPVTLATDDAPSPGDAVYKAITSVNAEMPGPVAAGAYLLMSDVTCYVRFNSATGGDPAVAQTAPAFPLYAGTPLLIRQDAAFWIMAICDANASGYICRVPMS